MELRILLLSLTGLVVSGAVQEAQDYKEELLLRHLPDGRVLGVFEFTTSWLVPPLAFLRGENGSFE